MTKIKGVLLDIDGTLTWKKAAIHGAVEAIGYLRSHGYPFRLLTNISARLPEHIAAELAAAGMAIAASEIQTSATACAANLPGSFLIRPSPRLASPPIKCWWLETMC